MVLWAIFFFQDLKYLQGRIQMGFATGQPV